MEKLDSGTEMDTFGNIDWTKNGLREFFREEMVSYTNKTYT